MSKNLKDKKVPDLRFSEFKEPLSLKYLGEILDFKNGINADKSQYGSGKKFINVLDIINDAPIYHNSIIGSVNITDKEFEKNNVVYGDILFQRSSEIREEAGQSNIYLDNNQEATFGGFVIRGRPKVSFNPIYFNYLLKTRPVRKEITNRSGGSTRFNVGQNSLSQVPILICELAKEQEKIASFLDAIALRTTQLRRKHELLETYKKGVMQKIFSQQIRFRQDDDKPFSDWEKKKLGEVTNFYKGKGISKENLVKSGKLKCIRYAELYTFYDEVISDTISSTNLDPDDLVLSIENDLIIPSSGETAIDIAKAACVKISGVALGGDLNILRTNIDGCFLAHYLNHHKKNEIAKVAQGNTVVHLYNSQLKTINIEIPVQKEQETIANFLTSIDKKIKAVELQIEKLEEFKKGLLQKMFV